MWAVQGEEIKKNNRKRTELKKEIDKDKKEFEKMRLMVEQEDKVKADLAIVEEAIKRLPSRKDRFNFFIELSDVLQLTGVKYSRITPKKAIGKNFYTELPYEIKCLARYHEFGQFLNMIEQNPNRFMRVKSFVVRNDKDRPSLHPVTLSLATFMFNQKQP
jgi:type IV pilus assembly protein PilO